jgi:catechol 2,3-dioxygenase-like lactoylglutathione lyase family enzyme
MVLRGGITMKVLVALTSLAISVAAPAYAQLAPPNAVGLTYGHVHLNVGDLELHKKLWVEHFDAVLVQKGTLTAVKLPGMLIALRAMAPSGPAVGTSMDHFGFKVRNLAEILKAWRAAGYQVEREFTGSEGFPNAYIVGPDVRVELQEDKTLPVKASGYHIHFYTPTPEKLRNWYVDTFSLVPRARGTIPVTADAPGMNLSFGEVDKPLPGTRGRGIDHIGFEVDNLEAFIKKLEAKGIKFDVAFRNVPAIELNIAYLTDPSGVYIELTEGYDKY